MPKRPSKSVKKKGETRAKPVRHRITLEELGLTGEEMELFGNGARLLFGAGKETQVGAEGLDAHPFPDECDAASPRDK